MDKLNQIITFKLGDEYFAFDIAIVKEILRVPRITRVPKTDDFILGMSNIRGNIVPIVDLNKRLKTKEKTPLTEDARLIIVDFNGDLVGFLVEKVEEVVSSQYFSIQQIPGIVSEKVDSQFIDSVVKIKSRKGERLIQLLDIFRLARMEKKMIGQEKIVSRTKEDKIKEEQEKVQSEKFISFYFLNREYALLIYDIREIIRYPEVTDVPGLPPYIKGIFSLRENIIPLISLSEKFGHKPQKIDDYSRVIIVEIENILVGLGVEKVNEVLSVWKKDIDIVPSFYQQNDKVIKNILKLNDGKRVALVLNLNEILSKSEIEMIKESTELQSKSFEVKEDKIQEEEKQFIIFTLENENYALPIEKVQEINRYTQVTRVPRSAKFIEGIINLRGEIIPIWDLRKKFNLKIREKDEFTRIIIVSLDKVKTGIIVDAVNEVLTVPISLIEPLPTVTATNIDNSYLNSVINMRKKGKMALILDVDKLFSKKEIAQMRKIAKKEDK